MNDQWKAFTSIEQSQKLAKILPRESADMFYSVGESKTPTFVYGSNKDFKYYPPCWSLTALLNILSDYTLQTAPDGAVFVTCTSNKPMISDAHNNPVDACLDMIGKLHELKQKPINNQFTPEQANILDKHIDEFLKQKPTDQVKPLEIGDLITDGILIGKVDEIHEWGCHACFGDCYADVTDLENWHKWTIQDAKDGDVLTSKDGNIILLFRGIGNKHWDGVIDYHCYYDCNQKKFVVQKDARYWGNVDDNHLEPATKKQRDLLFQKIKEADYEWATEKKGLKRLSKNLPQPQQEWSKEDEEMFNYALSMISWYSGTNESKAKSVIEWLTYLKERAQSQPKQQWKPTGSQLASLEIACDRNDRIGFDLTQLLKELKKLV